jgi:peptidoglycan hydrolase CwlO-like protein
MMPEWTPLDEIIHQRITIDRHESMLNVHNHQLFNVTNNQTDILKSINDLSSMVNELYEMLKNVDNE